MVHHEVFKFPIISSETTEFSKRDVLPFSNFTEYDPIWLPVKNWESLYSDNEESLNSSGNSLSNFLLNNRGYNPFVISEESLVRLAINAMNGIESSISTIDTLSAGFCSEITDRYIGISSLWSPFSSAHSLGRLLKCLGYSGRLVFILNRFSDYLTCSNFRSTCCYNEKDDLGFGGTCLVNQAFGFALKRILQGYASALDDMNSSVSSKPCVVHSKMTILKVYLQTQELRNHISSTASICNVIRDVLSCSDLSVEDLDGKCRLNFPNFPRGGDLLTYLYTKFRNADLPQYALLKFFFTRSCEPFCDFVRSWIYEAEISDPYGEFIGEKLKNYDKNSASFDYMDGVDLPCFLHGVVVPFSRAGRQVQIVRKLLRFCATINGDLNWVLPHWNMFSSRRLLFPFSLKLSTSQIREAGREMDDFYERSLHKLDDNSVKFNFADQIPFPVGDKYAFCCDKSTFTMSESCESGISESCSTSSQDAYESELQNCTGEGDYSRDSFEESYFSSLMLLKMTENEPLSHKYHSIEKIQSKTTDLERFLCSKDIITTGFSITGSPPHENNQVIGRQEDGHPWFFVHPQRNPFPFNNIGDGIEMMESSTNSMSSFQSVPDFSTTLRRKSDFKNNNSECIFFDFSFVEDASTACIDKLSSKIVRNYENCPPPSRSDSAGDLSFQSESEKSGFRDYYKSENSYCTMAANEKTNNKSGSSIEFESWVSLFYIPIDFVVSKSLRQEILLQYKYVSKLAMKLFDEVFQLKEHLLAVRRYLLLEVADWVHIFTSSLCRCKWQNFEAKILNSMVQGMLEASLEKSSCRNDPNKDRLYVYFRGDDDVTISHKIGVHSFEFIALGYRAGWPVNTILSTSALQKYTEMFSFLLHLNIVTTSLSNVWASLSGRVLSNMRYRVHHFVFTLQQHVQSRFKILWVAFIRSLERRIHDVMDLELTHIAYLNRALHVCFLTDETRRIGGIIEDIVQCAFDFGNLLHGIKLNENGDLTQILKTWSEFNKGVRDLYIFCQQSSENVNFDMSCFWDQLNYNEYYVNRH